MPVNRGGTPWRSAIWRDAPAAMRDAHRSKQHGIRFGLDRDDLSSNRHPDLAFSSGMIFSENRFPLFGIML
jgi:hypothetical protein